MFPRVPIPASQLFYVDFFFRLSMFGMAVVISLPTIQDSLSAPTYCLLGPFSATVAVWPLHELQDYLYERFELNENRQLGYDGITVVASVLLAIVLWFVCHLEPLGVTFGLYAIWLFRGINRHRRATQENELEPYPG